MGKFPLSQEASRFYRLGGKAIENYGYSLRFSQLHAKGERQQFAAHCDLLA
jgi:hypothetical protein